MNNELKEIIKTILKIDDFIQWDGSLINKHIDDIINFKQTWGSTALGFGGMGGDAMTSAYTTVLRRGNIWFVFFDGKFAYKVSIDDEVFYEDMKNRRLCFVKEAQERYNLIKNDK